MAGEKSWFRVYAFLPVGKFNEVRAAAEILNWLTSRLPGFTVSSTNGEVFDGYYRRNDGTWCYDPVSVLFLDHQFSGGARGAVAEFMELFGKVILATYAEFGSYQDEVMVAVHSLNDVEFYQLPMP